MGCGRLFVGPAVTGDLVGRKRIGSVWGELKTLAQGFLEYRPAADASVAGRWTFTGSRLPREHRRIYEKISIDPATAGPAHDQRVGGWTPVHLPLHLEHFGELGRILHEKGLHPRVVDDVLDEVRRIGRVNRNGDAAGGEDGVHDSGCYVAMEGPAFSTRAESLMHRLWGGDLIGMTAMPVVTTYGTYHGGQE